MRLAVLLSVLVAAAACESCDPDLDADHDGLPDALEDVNGDGHLNIDETNKDDPDTDDDGLCDGPLSVDNVCVGGEDKNANGKRDEGESDPHVKDTDGDGVIDGADPSPVDACVPLEESRACKLCLVGDFDVDASSTCAADVDCGADVCLNGHCAVRPPADAEPVIQLVSRNRAGDGFTDLADGGDVALILPPQGGKATMIGVKVKNVTCNLRFSGGLKDSCQTPPRFIATEGRTVVVGDAGDDGLSGPAAPETLQNYLNLDACPSVSSSRDVDGEVYDLELRITETPRAGETEGRSHVVTSTVVPRCADGPDGDDCRCECDSDFSNNLEAHPKEEQCPSINDNDVAGCPAP